MKCVVFYLLGMGYSKIHVLFPLAGFPCMHKELHTIYTNPSQSCLFFTHIHFMKLVLKQWPFLLIKDTILLQHYNSKSPAVAPDFTAQKLPLWSVNTGKAWYFFRFRWQSSQRWTILLIWAQYFETCRSQYQYQFFSHPPVSVLVLTFFSPGSQSQYGFCNI